MRRGELVAAVLAGAWRAAPPGPAISANQFEAILPALLESTVAPLAWWGLRSTSLGNLPAAGKLREAYRFGALEAAIHEAELRQVVTSYESAGIRPLLAKGWAIARAYPEPALRPCGDIDLWIEPERLASARGVVLGAEFLQHGVDLQSDFRYVDDRGMSEIRARAQKMALGDVEVTVVSPEDHLRILALHLLSHSARNPLWLCDIGAFVESLPPDFDWDYCLSGSPLCSAWVVCVLALAHQLLGAKVDHLNLLVDIHGYRLPRWLIPAVLRRWDHLGEHPYRGSLTGYLGEPAAFLEAFRDRWADPIETTFHWRGAPNNLPRWPYQLGDCLGRAFSFAARAGLTRLRPGAHREPPVAWRRWRTRDEGTRGSGDGARR